MQPPNHPPGLLDHLQSSALPWTANHTAVSGLAPEKHFQLFGYQPGPGEASLEAREQVSLARLKPTAPILGAVAHAVQSPTAVDWRAAKHGADHPRNFVTAVKAQSVCGACVAFGLAATIETQARVQLNIAANDPNGDTLPDLSEADLFYCSRHPSPGVDHTCLSGWNVTEALTYAQHSGIVTEACYPYNLGDILREDCERCSDAPTELTTISGFTERNSINDIKQWLATRGPLLTVFKVHFDFLFYHSGVYIKSPHPLNIPAGMHCVSCIGYDDTKQAWLCKNSWGTGWGDAGFFWIGYGQCGIDASMWAIDGFTAIHQLNSSK